MFYFQVRADLNFLCETAAVISRFREVQYGSRAYHANFPASYGQKEQLLRPDDYLALRDEIAERLPMLHRVSDRYLGTFNFYSVLSDLSDDINPRETSYDFATESLRIRDAINHLKGAIKHELLVAAWHTLCPLYWPFAAVAYLFRLPFGLMSAFGKESPALERFVAGHISKLVTFGICLVILIWKFGYGPRQALDHLLRKQVGISIDDAKK